MTVIFRQSDGKGICYWGTGARLAARRRAKERGTAVGRGSDTAQERRLGGDMDTRGAGEELTDSATAVDITGWI